jgi:hypothetical protein
MKKEEIPQDNSPLVNHFPELCYGKNEQGNYDTAQSTGWEVKTDALENAWDDIHQRIADAKLLVETGKKSPIYFYMEKNLMTITILASYMKISPIRVWWHLKPVGFRNLKPSILEQYSKVFKIPVKSLKQTSF